MLFRLLGWFIYCVLIPIIRQIGRSCTSPHRVAHILVFYRTLFTTWSDLSTISLPSFHCLFTVLLSFLWLLLCSNQHTPPRLNHPQLFTLYCSKNPSLSVCLSSCVTSTSSVSRLCGLFLLNRTLSIGLHFHGSGHRFVETLPSIPHCLVSLQQMRMFT